MTIIDNLSSKLEKISNKINNSSKPKSSYFVIIVVMVLSLIIGGIGGVFATESNYSILTSSIDATLAELQKNQKNKILSILKNI